MGRSRLPPQSDDFLKKGFELTTEFEKFGANAFFQRDRQRLDGNHIDKLLP
jgi:hypothetical protein